MYLWSVANPHLAPRILYGRHLRAQLTIGLLSGLLRGTRTGIVAALGLGRSIPAYLGRNRRRNQTIRELSRLDDRTLADIGVPRSHIRWVAETLVRSLEPAPGSVTRAVEDYVATPDARPSRANDNDIGLAA